MCFSSMLQALTLNSVNNFPALLCLYKGFLPQESSYSISGELMLFYCIYWLYLVRVQAPAVLNLSLCVFRTISLSIGISVCPLLNVGLLVFLTWNVFLRDCNKLMWLMCEKNKKSFIWLPRTAPSPNSLFSIAVRPVLIFWFTSPSRSSGEKKKKWGF